MTIRSRLGLQNGPDGYMAKMETNRVAQMTTWPTWGRPEWPRWLHGKDGDLKSGLDENMVKIGTTRKALMATWPKWGLPEWPRWLQRQYGD